MIDLETVESFFMIFRSTNSTIVALTCDVMTIGVFKFLVCIRDIVDAMCLLCFSIASLILLCMGKPLTHINFTFYFVEGTKSQKSFVT